MIFFGLPVSVIFFDSKPGLFSSLLFSFLSVSDTNECLRFGACSQICNNTKGSHKCSCYKHFIKSNDTCKVDGKDPQGTIQSSWLSSLGLVRAIYNQPQNGKVDISVE